MDKFSFLNSAHTSFFAEMYDQYLESPDSLEPSWKAFFQGFDFGLESANITLEEKKFEVPENIKQEFKVVNLINAYRQRGHLFTITNPVRERRKYSPTLDIENFGLKESDLELVFSAGEIVGIGPSKLKAIINKLKKIYCESIGNPSGNIVDISALSKMAHKHGVPVIVDNTVATPYFCKPIDQGADIVIHSLTKYIGGHGTTIGGVIIDSGKFPFKDNARFPLFNTPDPSYHGVVYADALEAPFIGRARVVPLRNMGAALSPFNAFMILQGLETLALRMDRHVENAMEVAEYLNNHDQVSWVNYAGLKTDRYHELSKTVVDGKPSSIISFGIKGGEAAGAKFCLLYTSPSPRDRG